MQRFKSTYATLPRLLLEPYKFMGDAPDILKKFRLLRGQDHDSRFRAVAISATTSLLAFDVEAPPKTVFVGASLLRLISRHHVLSVAAHKTQTRTQTLTHTDTDTHRHTDTDTDTHRP